ncbi:MAG: MFS transporter [Burkholderiales bacterium]
MKPLHLLLSLSLLNHLSFVGTRLAVLIYAAHLNASPAVIGVLAALFAIFSALTSVSVGRWIDRSGPRGPMLYGTIFMVAGGVLAFLWREVAALFIVAVVVGTFHNVFHMVQAQLVGRYGEPKDRAANFSLSSLSNSAASFLGPVIAGFGIDHIGHPNTFLGLAFFALLPLPIILANLLTFPPVPEGAAKSKHDAAGSAWSLLRDPPLLRIYIVSILANGTWSVVNFMLPLYGLQIGLDATRIGTMMGVFAAATVLIRLGLPFIIRFLLPWQLMVVSLFASGTGFLMVPFTEAFVPLTLICFWIGIGLGLSGPMTMTLLYEASPPNRQGEVIGMRVTVQNVCQAAVPLFSGVVGAAMGVGPVFWAISALILWGCFHNRGQLRGPLRK